MARAAFVGGFASNATSNLKIGNALAQHFEDVDTFSFSDLIWTDRDLFFRPTESHIQIAEMNGVPVLLLAGQHDEAYLHPETFVYQALKHQ